MQKQKVKRAITSLMVNKEDASESYQQCKQWYATMQFDLLRNKISF